MVTASHQIPTCAPAGLTPVLLEQAFSDFIAASARLEASYRTLQAEVAELRLALLEQQQALADTRSEKGQLEQLMGRVVESMPCGVMLVQEDGTVLLANPVAADLLALSSAGMPDLGSIHQQTGVDLLEDAAGEAQGAREWEMHFASSAGQHWIAIQRSRLRQPGRHTPGTVAWLVTLQDISARKRAEAERERARDAAALAQVAALLAHEVRNPLASMELFADLLVQSPERQNEWISHLRAGIRSLAGTVNNVLTLNGEAPLPTERLDLLREVAPAIRFLQPLAQQSEVHLHLQTQVTALWVRSNRTALMQMLLNLCTNAFRHSPPGANVTIHCVQGPAGEPRLEVQDSGPGITLAQQQRIFEAGFSGSPQRAGLGLAVCRRLMEQQHGSISVCSMPGAGTTFTLEFEAA